MNERFERLAAQAGMVRGGYANTPEKIMTWREDFDNPGSLEKFAELIVQECIGVADHSNVTGKSIVGKRIKQHFGVE